ncbi:Mov34/MPN/PAD-1 family protein [Mariprofundus ferrooxydans]|uniref:Mov34/MPN/PAD-1 family protein n=1 Tax=Mariprofundus ferrooxydans TaxID=314344 RepID=UPI00142FD0F0|nr:Mov34/MPN/PAD-1 family protein [Mariprofundus ferrooxydans]
MSKRVWISKSALAQMMWNCECHYPRETGGILLGYFGDNGEPVITRIIGPGAGAVHSQMGFHPDHEFQMRQLEQAYIESNGDDDYLGDWHSHPKCDNRMSHLDRKTLTGISRSTAPKLAEPLMLILTGRRSWEPACYQLSLLPKCKLVPARFRRLDVKNYMPE